MSADCRPCIICRAKFVQRSGSWPVISTGLTIPVLFSWIYVFWGTAGVAPDSATYLSYVPRVPLGYPLFLSAVKTLTGSAIYAPSVQLALLVFAFWLLADSAYRLSGSLVVGVSALVLQLTCNGVLLHTACLLSEGVYIPLLLLNAAFAIQLARRFSRFDAIALGTTAALLAFVRPSGYFALVAVVYFIIVMRRHFKPMLAWALIPMISLMIGTFTLNWMVRGNAVPHQVGRVLLPHVAFFFDASYIDPRYAEAAHVIEEAFAPYRTEYFNQKNLIFRFRYNAQTYNIRLKRAELQLKQIGQEITPELFWTTVAAHPVQYASLICEQVAGAWLTRILADWNDLGFRLADFQKVNRETIPIIERRGLPLTREQMTLDPGRLETWGAAARAGDIVRPVFLWTPDRSLVYATAIAMLLALILALIAPTPYAAAVGYLGALVHGTVLLNAMTTVFIKRYAVPIDPIILVSTVLLVQWGALATSRSMRMTGGQGRLSPQDGTPALKSSGASIA